MTLSSAQRVQKTVQRPLSICPSKLVAPVENRYEGDIKKKPWEYRITAVIPHLNTPEILEIAVKILQLQTEKPYILIIDTGSDQDMEHLRGKNCEIHYLKSHSWKHPSEPVSVAQDLALAMCKTEFMFCTHADCFLKTRTLLAEWLDLMSNHSVVGYQISPRPYKGWENEFGHTALMFNVKDIKSKNINWDMQEFCRAKGKTLKNGVLGPNCPDTESNFNRLLQLSGLKYLFLGGEENFIRNSNQHFDHPRSFASSKIYNSTYHKNISPAMQEAICDAEKRILRWENEL